MRLTELTGNIVYPWLFDGASGDEYYYSFLNEDNLEFKVVFNYDEYIQEQYGLVKYEVVFAQIVNGEYLTDTTGTGDAIAVFSTVIDICRDFLTNRVDADILSFKGTDENNPKKSRSRLYVNAAPQIAKKLGRVAKINNIPGEATVYLIKPDKVDQVTKLYRNID